MKRSENLWIKSIIYSISPPPSTFLSFFLSLFLSFSLPLSTILSLFHHLSFSNNWKASGNQFRLFLCLEKTVHTLSSLLSTIARNNFFNSKVSCFGLIWWNNKILAFQFNFSTYQPRIFGLVGSKIASCKKVVGSNSTLDWEYVKAKSW